MVIEVYVGLAVIFMYLLARKNFWHAIMVVTALLPAYSIRFHMWFIPTNALEVLIAAVALAAILGPAVWLSWKSAWQKLPAAIKTSTAFFVLAAIVSVYISPQLQTSAGIFKSWVLIPILFAWLIYAARPSPQQKKQLLHALIWSGSVVSLIALCLGLTDGRLQAFYDTPNSLALYIAPILAATIWQMMTETKQKNSWLFVAAATQAAALLGSQSLAGSLSLIVSLFIGSLYWRKGKQLQKSLLLGSIIILIVLITFISTGKFRYLLEPLKDPSVHNSATVRLQLWSISWDLIQENPLLGIGLGQFEPAYQQKLHERFLNPAIYYPQPIPEFVFRDPHNWLLSFYLNAGLLGLLAFIALNVFILKRNWQSQNRVTQTYTILLISYLLFGLVDTIYWKNDLSIIHFLLLAILVVEG